VNGEQKEESEVIVEKTVAYEDRTKQEKAEREKKRVSKAARKTANQWIASQTQGAASEL